MVEFNKTTKSVAERTRTTNRAGGEAFAPEDARTALLRLTLNNLLEDTYYRDDADAVHEVAEAVERVATVDPEFVLQCAAYAREEHYLRDISQFILALAATHDETKPYVRAYAPKIIQRADEPATVIAIWESPFLPGGTLPNALKKGIADALHQFDAYQLAKYRQAGHEVTLYDVFNRVHPKPADDEEAELWKRFMLGSLDSHPEVDPLPTPHTWETVISEQGNHAGAWREVLPDMGLFAIVRNLRNMLDAGVDDAEIVDHLSLEWVRNAKLYPFRFYQAYKAIDGAGRYAPTLTSWLNSAIETACESLPDDLGRTHVGVDLSGSMTSPLSRHSSLTYKEIGMLFGAALATKGATVSGFGASHARVPMRSDVTTFDRMDAIRAVDKQVGQSTNGHLVLDHLAAAGTAVDRVVIFTDMQLWNSNSGALFGRRSSRSLRDAFAQYRERFPEVTLYVVDLSSYGTLVMPENAENVYQIGGWNSKMIDLMAIIETPEAEIEQIKAIEPAREPAA